jgi:outer membrane protein assembly factor BamB
MQLTNFPPWPFNPFPDLPLYTDGSGNYYYDDRSVDYAALWSAGAASSSVIVSGGMAQVQGPPAPGGGSGGSGGGATVIVSFTPPASGYFPCQTWTNFWLEFQASADVLNITISNTLAGMSYILLAKTNLNDPEWVPIQTLTATGPTTAASPVSMGTNQLFFAAALTTNDLPPVITVPPSNQVAAAGGTAVFSVTATGLGPLGYQWQLDGTNLAGQTATNLTISNVKSNNAGAYTVLVTNAICEASATAGLGLIWSNNLGAAMDASPAIARNGDIFIATTGSMLFALDVSGNIKWSTAVTTGQDGLITSSASLAADGSAVYIGSQDSGGGYLEAFNPTNGGLLWQINLGAYVNSTPAISAGAGAIYAGVCNGGSNGLFSINPTTHQANWFFQIDDPFYDGLGLDSSPAVGPGCSAYFMGENILYAVNPAGALAWFFPLPSARNPSASPALDAAGNILIGSSDGYVYCVSPAGGLRWLWDTGTGSSINSSIAVGANGWVVAATENGILFAITNGVLAWQWTNSSGGGFSSSPLISQDNEVVIGSLDDSIFISAAALGAGGPFTPPAI